MKCDELEAEQWLDYSGEPMPCYPKAKADKVIADKDKEIAKLKENYEAMHKAFAKYVIDASERECRLKRALYKACANWMIDRQCAMSCFHLEARAKKFDKAIDKCRAMADKFKRTK